MSPIWLYRPLLSVFAWYLAEPLTGAIVTVAPSTGFPAASVTRPPSLCVCAVAGAATDRTISAAHVNIQGWRPLMWRTMNLLLNYKSNERLVLSLPFFPFKGRGGVGPGPAICEKSVNSRQVAHHGRRGQRGDEAATVSFCLEARIEHGQHAPVEPVADQAAEALLQREDREGKLVFAERIAALLANRVDPRCGHRV